MGLTADPTNANRVQIRIPAIAGQTAQWARVCRPFGAQVAAPRIGGEVLIAFEAGDPLAPYVIGGLW